MLNLNNLREDRIKDIKEKIELLDNDKANKYILGINEYCDKILEYFKNSNIKINGIIDDFSPKKNYKNNKIVKLREIEKDSLIINCVIDGKLVDINEKLKNMNIKYIINYCDFILINEKLSISYLNDFKYDIETNINKYEELYEKLYDKKSKKCLQDIINFRYNMDYKFLKDYSLNLGNQYFEEFIDISNCYNFVDCGAFDGQTSMNFIEKNPNYSNAYVFEPSKSSYFKCLDNLTKYKNINLFNCGVYNKNTDLIFDSQKGSASKIDSSGVDKIKCVKIDDAIKQKVDFIKMDVEGAEYEALLGAKKIIQSYKPKLAICVYHNQEHFWKIPELILSYKQDYKIYIRHYTRGLLETVMYFI